MVLAGPTATGVTLRRSSPRLQLDQKFAVDSKEKDVSITMTLRNISGASIPDVRLTRAYDPDVDGDADDDVEVKFSFTACSELRCAHGRASMIS
jgi:hypothetical protein